MVYDYYEGVRKDIEEYIRNWPYKLSNDPHEDVYDIYESITENGSLRDVATPATAQGYLAGNTDLLKEVLESADYLDKRDLIEIATDPCYADYVIREYIIDTEGEGMIDDILSRMSVKSKSPRAKKPIAKKSVAKPKLKRR